jgi:hypothetical protein
VSGARDATDADLVFGVLQAVHIVYHIDTIIEGGARGVDRFAREWANREGVAVETYEADWEHLGRRAGVARNMEMARANPTLVLAFPGPNSVGTWSMVGLIADA